MAKRGRRPESKKTEELAALRARVTKCEKDADDLVEEERAVHARLEETEEVLVKTLVHRRSAKAEQKAFETARDRANEPWPQKQEAARRRVALAKAEIIAFITANYADLVAELRPRADAARQRIETGFAAAKEASVDWHEVTSGWEAYAEAIGDPECRSPDGSGLDRRLADLASFTVPDPIGTLSPVGAERVASPPPEQPAEAADAVPAKPSEPSAPPEPPEPPVSTPAPLGEAPMPTRARETRASAEPEPETAPEPEPTPSPEPEAAPAPNPEPKPTPDEKPEALNEEPVVAQAPPESGAQPASQDLVVRGPPPRRKRPGLFRHWRAQGREQLP